MFWRDMAGYDHGESSVVEVKDLGADQVTAGVTLAEILVNGYVHRWDLHVYVVACDRAGDLAAAAAAHPAR